MMENFTIVLTSSVLAAGITSVVNYLIQRNNYRDDYHKKVIDKRMSAYQKLFEVNGKLEMINYSENHRKSHVFLRSKATYDHYVVNLGITGFEGIWYSEKLSALLTDFNVFLYQKFNDAVTSDQDVDSNMSEIAESNYEEVVKFKNKIKNQLVEDLLNMHKVQEFLEVKASANSMI